MSELTPRVLYIDDDDGLRQLAKRALSRRGYDVALAASGTEGVERLRTKRFDLVAVDHYMPELDGLATLQLMRELPEAPPIIYVTGSDETSIAVAALKAGAVDYIVKTMGDDFFELLANAFGQALAQVQLAAGKRQAEAAMHASNLRLEALLREVNHRVANSLALISSFVQMQSREVTHGEAKEALQDTQMRIQAVAQVHRRLYTSAHVEKVAMNDYLASLVSDLEETWSTPQSPRTMTLLADPIDLDTDKAVSVGVIVNELISNACKYAYQAAQGEVRIAFLSDGPDHFLLRVEDDGNGLPTHAAPRGSGLGSRLVHAMVQSLGGEIDYHSRKSGLRVSLRAARQRSKPAFLTT